MASIQEELKEGLELREFNFVPMTRAVGKSSSYFEKNTVELYQFIKFLLQSNRIDAWENHFALVKWYIVQMIPPHQSVERYMKTITKTIKLLPVCPSNPTIRMSRLSASCSGKVSGHLRSPATVHYDQVQTALLRMLCCSQKIAMPTNAAFSIKNEKWIISSSLSTRMFFQKESQS